MLTFTPQKNLTDEMYSPDDTATPREDIQGVSDEIVDFINSGVIPYAESTAAGEAEASYGRFTSYADGVIAGLEALEQGNAEQNDAEHNAIRGEIFANAMSVKAYTDTQLLSHNVSSGAHPNLTSYMETEDARVKDEVISFAETKILTETGDKNQLMTANRGSIVAAANELYDRVRGQLEFVYNCTGTEDNAAISGLVNDFFDGTGDFTGTAAKNMKLCVTGNLDLNVASPSYPGGNTPADPSRYFNFVSQNPREAKVIIDWADARFPALEYTGAGAYLAGFFIDAPGLIFENLLFDISRTASGDLSAIYKKTTGEFTVNHSEIRCDSAVPGYIYGINAGSGGALRVGCSSISLSAIEGAVGILNGAVQSDINELCIRSSAIDIKNNGAPSSAHYCCIQAASQVKLMDTHLKVNMSTGSTGALCGMNNSGETDVSGCRVDINLTVANPSTGGNSSLYGFNINSDKNICVADSTIRIKDINSFYAVASGINITGQATAQISNCGIYVSSFKLYAGTTGICGSVPRLLIRGCYINASISGVTAGPETRSACIFINAMSNRVLIADSHLYFNKSASQTGVDMVGFYINSSSSLTRLSVNRCCFESGIIPANPRGGARGHGCYIVSAAPGCQYNIADNIFLGAGGNHTAHIEASPMSYTADATGKYMPQYSNIG